jgi:olfactory receptor
MKKNIEESEFILLGLTKSPELQVLLLMILTFIYAITLTGNLGMFLLILLDAHLHTPMYFFLRNLSLVDLGLPQQSLQRSWLDSLQEVM